MAQGNKLWGGRFKEEAYHLVGEYTDSLDCDRLFARHDVLGSMAHARMLAKQGIISAQEAEQLLSGLDSILKEIEQGSFPWRRDMEDVHLNIEHRLTELLGPVGQKLHTGRSRNDQVALDFRLYVSERLQAWEDGLLGLIASLMQQAERHAETIMPGYTHLQPAQPVTLAQHLLAYCQMFRRDAERIADSQKRTRVSPLGAAALGGTTYPLDPQAVADELGFAQSFRNSLDAVSDRDFVLEAVFVSSLIMTHLSRLCEELVLWANPGFGFVLLPDSFATGSSIMPQKKNPDVAELMRGKTGRTYGALMSLFTMLKGLPLAYNRDLQEDKPPFADADRTVDPSLRIMAQMMEAMEFDPQRMRQATRSGFLNATELADYLVGKGIPFRQAHHITGQAVAYAEEQGKHGLEDLGLDELRSFSPLVDADVYAVLDYSRAVAKRMTRGGTGYDPVGRQMEELKAWLEEKGAPWEEKSGGSV